MDYAKRYEELKKQWRETKDQITSLQSKLDNIEVEMDQMNEYVRDHGDADQFERE